MTNIHPDYRTHIHSALAVFFCYVFLAFPESDLIDFESYIVGSALKGQDSWQFHNLVQLDLPDDFVPTNMGDGVVLRCATQGLTEYYRSVPSHNELTEFLWRWRALSTDAALMIGPSVVPHKTNNNYGSYFCRVQMDGGKWGIKGKHWESPSSKTWQAGQWYYCRMLLDIPNGTFSVYTDTDPSRGSETAQVVNAPLARSGPIEHIMIKADQSAGTIDIDDIWWGSAFTKVVIEPGTDIDMEQIMNQAIENQTKPYRIVFMPGTYKGEIKVQNEPVVFDVR
ncbi:MAG: hypothetical protein GF344_03475 [Chitinivibrionales bacterium]|nr:hypothetical protein [Chitinivibrionales bacterium]MBD3356132.1 hypothetical protein [Chitinivibrionales bacterium]